MFRVFRELMHPISLHKALRAFKEYRYRVSRVFKEYKVSRVFRAFKVSRVL